MNRNARLPRCVAQFAATAALLSAALPAVAGEVTWTFQGNLRNETDWTGGNYPPGAAYTLAITLDDEATDLSSNPVFGAYQNFVTQISLSIPSAGVSRSGPPDFNRLQIDRDGTIDGQWDARIELELPEDDDGPRLNFLIEWIDPDFATLTDDSLAHPFTDASAFHYIWIEFDQAISANFEALAAFDWLRPSPGSTAPEAIRKTGYRGMYVFGDSLSADTDPAFNQADADQYFEGGYTNGPVWVQYLAWRMGIPYDKANNFSQFLFAKPFSSADVAGEPTADSLFIHWSNTPLFAAILQGQFTDPDSPETIRSKVGNQAGNARALLDAFDRTFYAGGKNLLILGVADVTFAPFIAAFVSPDSASAIRDFVDQTNAGFATLIGGMKDQFPTVAATLIDPNDYLDPVKANPATFNITNIEVSALEGGGETPPVADTSLDGPGASYFFWTGTAPTTRVHCYLAGFIFDDVFSVGSETEDAPYLRLVEVGGDTVRLLAGNLDPGQPVQFFDESSLPGGAPSFTFTPGDPCRLIDLARGSSPQRFFWIIQD